jgi:predicted RecB family nuclease
MARVAQINVRTPRCSTGHEIRHEVGTGSRSRTVELTSSFAKSSTLNSRTMPAMRAHNGSIQLSPSDLTAHLACEHLTMLNVKAARGDAVPMESSDQADLLAEKGLAHEAAYLARLRDEGLSVREVSTADGFDAAAIATRGAIVDGVDVVYQGVLVDGTWRGVADFLLRTDDGTYEALDTKLARSAKPAYILQLCFYSELLGHLQGNEPDSIHVLLGSGEQQSFRPRDFEAYARHVRRGLERFITAEPATEPAPCGHCDVCGFSGECGDWWEQVDHLSRVAGCGRLLIDRLAAGGITTMRALASADPSSPPHGINREIFEKLHRQAALQSRRHETGELEFVLLDPRPERGFALLPAPSPGDIFFDIEGNPFWDEQGSLEYLWGLLDADHTFTPLWAEDHVSERRAFQELVDRVRERLAQHPDMHLYHYASYEVSALRRLAGRYNTREAEVDDLLARGVLVDLFKVVRGGLAASVPGYGLKEMEAYVGFGRDAQIRDGATSIIEHERYIQTRDAAILDTIAAYNREDCVATLLLRDWLLARRAEALERFGPLPLPEPKEPRPITPAKQRRQELHDQLTQSGDSVLEFAAGLLDYHDRERKPGWWAFFDRIELSDEELVEDPESLGLLDPDGEPEVVSRSRVHRFIYPAQEHKLGLGHTPFDPATRERAGEIVEFDRQARTLALKRGPSLADVPLPTALLPGEPYKTKAQEDALERIGRSLLAGDKHYPVVESILRRDPFSHDIQTTDFAEMVDVVLSLDGRHLVVQGPPGTGKTWMSGRLIARLLAEGKQVGVASTSHKAIHKLLDEIEAAGIDVRGVKKCTGGNAESVYESAHVTSDEDRSVCLEAPLSGGTAWLYSHADFDRTLDYLFIDEAGQVSLADALAMTTSARNVVLVGDPQQLAQVLQGSHPDGIDESVLQYLLAGHATIPADQGLFLETTYRLHPDVGDYISDEFYEGRVRSDPSCATRTTPLGTGLRFCPVDHDGCRQESRAEADRVAAEIERVRAAGVPCDEIVVVAPYNAQVNLLLDLLPEDVRVGTVDKFQGQEARVVLYTMASSSGEDVPRGLEFLLSRNRLNVAISRAQCLAYLVCSPRLLDVNCRTIDQMRLANALCRFVEFAEG